MQKASALHWPARRDDSAAALPCAACPRSKAASDFAAENVPQACFLNAAHPLRVRIPPNEKTALTKVRAVFFGPPEGIRTPDLQNRNLTLYPAALRADKSSP